jgi:3-hydroxyisobutyrate dehydrogenase-like beta-hydroxyacid dehydrogenase
MEIGFIGLGNLGKAMVENLIGKGHKIHVYNRTENRMESFKNRAQLHTSLSSIAQASDIIFSTVSDDKALESISFGSESLIENMKSGAVHVCLSTIAPSTAVSLNSAYQQKGIDYITATVIGRPEAVRNRNLVICYSGVTSKKEVVFSLLKDLGGAKIFEFGDDPKMAAVVKVCNNFMIVAALETMGEAFNLLEKSGVQPQAFYEMITDTIFNSPIYKNYGKIIIEKNYKEPGFTSQLGLKDTKLALGLAEELSAPLPIADLIRNRFLINHNKGRKDWDWTSIVAVIKEENEINPHL